MNHPINTILQYLPILAYDHFRLRKGRIKGASQGRELDSLLIASETREESGLSLDEAH